MPLKFHSLPLRQPYRDIAITTSIQIVHKKGTCLDAAAVVILYRLSRCCCDDDELSLSRSFFRKVGKSEVAWSMSRLPVFSETLDAVCMAGRAGAEQAVISDANTVSVYRSLFQKCSGHVAPTRSLQLRISPKIETGDSTQA